MKKIGEPLLKRLSKPYEPSSMVHLKFKSYNLAIKTDEEGMQSSCLLVKPIQKV